MFTDKHGNIINDENDNEMPPNADTTCDDADYTTGVYDDMHDDITCKVNENNGVIRNVSGIETNTHDITGVMDDTNDTYDITGVTHDTINNTVVDKHTAEKDDISIESEEHEDDNHVKIDDLSIIEQINTTQINTDPETSDDVTDSIWCTVGNHGYNLRPCPISANSKYALTQDGQQSAETKMAKPHAHVMITQMIIKQDIKVFGECGSNAMLKELNQLHEQNALLPLRKEDMSYEQRKKALCYLMFLKQKHDGTIKARGCADGRSQRAYTTKYDTRSPTVSLEAMMMSCAIDVKENRYVAVADIPGS